MNSSSMIARSMALVLSAVFLTTAAHRAFADNSAYRPASTSCDGLKNIHAPNALVKNGAITQNLADPGFVLEGVPVPLQGYRDGAGSCTMAATITAINGYAKSRSLRVEPIGHSFFQLGEVNARGGWDEAIEKNFTVCLNHYQSFGVDGAMSCVSEILKSKTCQDSLPVHAAYQLNQELRGPADPSCPTEIRRAPGLSAAAPSEMVSQCSAPKIVPHGSPNTGQANAQGKRDFIRDYYANPDRTKIIPLGMPWNNRSVTRRFDLLMGDINHASTLIGRRLTSSGRCQLLVRNSWNFCLSGNPSHYRHAECDHPGPRSLGGTEDIWVDEARLLNYAGALYEYQDP